LVLEPRAFAKTGSGQTQQKRRKQAFSAAGITLYAPNINLVRDPRWGRAEEVFGECPHLTSELVPKMHFLRAIVYY